jgi:hypothetical protein
MHSETEFLFWEENCPFMTNNKNRGKKVNNHNHKCAIHRNTTNASCKMLFYLAKWFQRRRFLEINQQETRITYGSHVC